MVDIHQHNRNAWDAESQAFEFSHSLDDQIGGQIDAGFAIAGLYEDSWTDEASRLNPYMPIFIATLAIKN